MALDQIRKKTAGVHERLDARLGVMARLADPVLRARLWESFYGFYGPAEAEMAPWLDQVETLEAPRRRKLPALERDLDRMGVDALARAALARWTPPPVTSACQALGMAYVMEGATLGGRAILKASAKLGIEGEALSFYDVYGRDTGPMWKRYCAALEQTCASPDAAAVAADAALRTFTAIETWLCDSPTAATHDDTRAA